MCPRTGTQRSEPKRQPIYKKKRVIVPAALLAIDGWPPLGACVVCQARGCRQLTSQYLALSSTPCDGVSDPPIQPFLHRTSGQALQAPKRDSKVGQ